MMYQSIKEELVKLLEGDVSVDAQDLSAHATDWSLFSITPDLIVYPKSTHDIQKLVEYVNKYNASHETKLSVTARAAGSGMSGGSLNHSIIVDVTRYMNNFKEIVTGDFGTQQHTTFPYQIVGKATAEPGMMYIPFEEKTLEKSMIMPTFPASRKICAIGGMVANNGAGEKSLKYGQNKDFVDSLKVVLADGKEYSVSRLTYKELQQLFTENHLYAEVSQKIYTLVKENWDLIQEKRPQTAKNSAGYLIWDVISAPSIEAFEKGEGYFDLTKLIVGAQGTTGIITEITYKLVPHEDKEEMLVMFVDDIHQLPKIVEVLKKYDLETIELYDDNTFNIGVKFFGDFIKDKGFFSAIRYSLRFLPELWMVITGGVPKFIILAESVDKNQNVVHAEVLSELSSIRKALPHMKSFIVKGKENAQKYWDFRHDSFKLLTEHSLKSRSAGKGTRTAPFIDDIAVPPQYLDRYIPELVEILDEYKDEFLYTIAGHLGDGNFHVIPLVDMNKEENRSKILEISERVYTLALKYGGSITAEHNDGIVRTPYIPQMFGSEMHEIFVRVKEILDPHTIFNPGKKVGMKKEDIQRYLA